MNLFDLSAKISLDSKNFDNGIENAKNGMSKLSSWTIAKGQLIADGIKLGISAVNKLGKSMVDQVSNTAQFADNIDKMSQKMGLSAEKYQEWDFIMQHSGTSMESLKAGMKTLANAVANGNEAFGKLGITQEKIAKMSQEELFEATLSGLQNVKSETERTYLAGQLLGRGATELGALLNTSAEDTEAMKQQIHDLGGVMTDEAVKAGAAFQDSLQNLQVAFGGLKNNLAADFLPNFVKIMDGMSAVASGDDSGFDSIEDGLDELVDNIFGRLRDFSVFGARLVGTLAESIAKKIPDIIYAGADLISYFMESMAESSAMNSETIGQIIEDIVWSFYEYLPSIIDSAVVIVSNLAQGLAAHLPEIIRAVTSIVIDLTVYTLTSPENLGLIIDSALALIMALTTGLLDAIPELIDAIPTIIENLVMAITENLPKIIEAGIMIIGKLAVGIIKAKIQLASKAPELIMSLIQGIVNCFGNLVKTGKDIVNKVKDGFWQKIEDAKQWGRDLIDNFTSGIKDKWNKLKDTVGQTADKIKSYLGFSEPEMGPLSNFHTYAPDMMKLFTKGIKDNEHLITDQINKSFDFGEKTISAGYNVASSQGVNASQGNFVIRIDDSNAMGLARALAPMLKIVQEEAFA